MKSLFAFIKKEITEQIRSGRLLILGILFVLFGIMNPAVAKLTPWFLEIFAESLAESGMTITEVTVSALDSWMQFFKNIPMALIIFVLMQGSIFTKEYSSGTLILSLTKGLERFKVIIAKTVVLATIWTVYYWTTFVVTYGYNAHFWDNSVAQNLTCSVLSWWVFGLWIIVLMILLSTICNSMTGVLLGTGGIVLVSYLIGLLPKCSKYLPTLLMDGTSLIYGKATPDTYIAAIIITVTLSIVCFAVSVPIFDKKQL